MNPWVLFFLILAIAMLPGALILGGINILTFLGVSSLLVAALIAWYRPRKARR